MNLHRPPDDFLRQFPFIHFGILFILSNMSFLVAASVALRPWCGVQALKFRSSGFFRELF
jgi:hypothetical protein